MRLVDLDAELVARLPDGGLWNVDTVQQAQGVIFDCPACGRHSILVWFRGRVAADVEPRARWDASGITVADLTLSPSVHLTDPKGCGWHGFVRNGEATP